MRGISIDDLPERYQQQVRAQLAANPARSPDTKPKHNAQATLGNQSKAPESMVHSDRPLLVRITRFGREGVRDTDNLAGGCKELRDAIADAFGRTGDSAKEGFTWEYEQKNSD